MHFHRFKSIIGPINTVVHKDNLLIVSLPGETMASSKEQARRLTGETEFESATNLNLLAERQILAYLDGKLAKFDLPLTISGTELQKCTLDVVARIPFGQTLTYKQVAEKTGHPKAARAVGSTMARNSLPIVIPCHRVLAVNGPGGYAGGLPMKLRLLKLEGVSI